MFDFLDRFRRPRKTFYGYYPLKEFERKIMPKINDEVTVYYTVIEPNEYTYTMEAIKKLEDIDKYLLYTIPVEIDKGLLAYFTDKSELNIKGFARENLDLSKVKDLRLVMLNLYIRDFRAFMDKHYFLYFK